MGESETGGGPSPKREREEDDGSSTPDAQKARNEAGGGPASTKPAGPTPAAGQKRSPALAFGDKTETGIPPGAKKPKELVAADLSSTGTMPNFPDASGVKRGGKTLKLIFPANAEEITKYLDQLKKGSLDDKVCAILARGEFPQVEEVIKYESPKRLLESPLEKKYAYGKNDKGNSVFAKYTLYPIHLLILNDRLNDDQVKKLTEMILSYGPGLPRSKTRLSALVNATARIPTAAKTKPTEKTTMQLAIESNMKKVAELLFEGPAPTDEKHRLYTLGMCVGRIKGDQNNTIPNFAILSGWYTANEIGEKCESMVGAMKERVSKLPLTADEDEARRETSLENIAGTLGYCMANMDLSKSGKREILFEVTQELDGIKKFLVEEEKSSPARPPGEGEEDPGIDDFSKYLKQIRTDNETEVNDALGRLRLARTSHIAKLNAAKELEAKSSARAAANKAANEARAKLESAEEEYKNAVLKQNLFFALRLYGGLFAENTADDIVQPLMRTVELSKYPDDVVEVFVKKALEGAFVSKCINPHEGFTGIPPQLWIVVGRMIALLNTDAGKLLHRIIIAIMKRAPELLREAPQNPTTSSKVITGEFLQTPLGFRLMQAVIESGDRGIFEAFMESGLKGVRMSQIYDPMETGERPGDDKTDEATEGLTDRRRARSKKGRSLAMIMNEQITQAKSSTVEPEPDPDGSGSETEVEDLDGEDDGANQAETVEESNEEEKFVPRERLLQTETGGYKYPTEFPELLFPEAGDAITDRAARAEKFGERIAKLSADMWKKIEEEHAKEKTARAARLAALLEKAQKEKAAKDAILAKAEKDGVDSLTEEELAILA